jgi:GNAT superfamily N-acetyltransferase
MEDIRMVRPQDLEALYAITLATGRDGDDAGDLYKDPRIIGHIYSAPYAVLHPESVLVIEDGDGVGGYVAGVADTRAFEARLETLWWPALRSTYVDPSGTPHEAWTADELRAFMIHHPRPAPAAVAGAFPAHVHMNLLPRLQGRGLGSALLEAWLERCAPGHLGVHVGVSQANQRGQAFWSRQGFEALDAPSRRTRWMGRRPRPR